LSIVGGAVFADLLRIRKAVTNDLMIREVAAQVIASSGFEIGDDSSVSAQIRTRLSRLLNEGLV
jgi:hypothetical protein